MASGLNDNHRRHLLSTFEHVDKLLTDALQAMACAESPSPFQRCLPDSLPVQRKVIGDYITRLRGTMVRSLEKQGIAVPKPQISSLWSFRSTLLFARTAVESPVVYREVGTAAAKLREFMPRYHAPISCMYPYLHMAQGNSRQYLQGDVVWVKKYFYVLRPVLACLWIERGFGVVPTEFRVLVDRLVADPALRAAIDDLLARKRAGQELDQGPRIPRVSDFLDHELARLAAAHGEPPETRDPAALDELFLDLLVEAYGDRLMH